MKPRKPVGSPPTNAATTSPPDRFERRGLPVLPRALGSGLLVIGAVALSACGSGDDGTAAPLVAQPGARTAQQACALLSGATLGGATGLTTTVVAAAQGQPTYCKVNGVILPKLNFEVRLPDRWNGKLYYQGGGGFDGSIPALAQPALGALVQGYAIVGSDSGHQAGTLDATWALNDAYAAQLWGSLSVPTVVSTALSILKSTYDSAPTRAYFEGCSNGGREGLMAVERDPNLFDGVIARSSAYNIVGFFGHWNSNAKALSAPGAAMSNAKVALLAKAVRDACDANDGIVDGIVSNPGSCVGTVKPSSLRCVGGADTGDTCLSDAQIQAVDTITSAANFGSGSTVFHDAARPLTGNEDDPGAWPQWITGNGNVRTTTAFALQDSAVKSFIARDLTVDSLTYSPYDKDINALFALSSLSDATKTDIRPFVNHGGKLILWHGGNDAAFPPLSDAENYTGIVGALGGQTLADRSVRFYVAPGVNHCAGGPGADTSDLITALDGWVTSGSPPETLLASKVNAAGGTDFTRPLCRYPQYPRYTGPANDAAAAKVASNYTCTAP